MENPKVSILVPIYNVEKYLPRCIDSVLSQDFQDYELILVDDGSPDGCPQICDEYAAKDSRIKVVHKKNGGLVSARLAGFKEARGKYIMHVDSDDYLLPRAVSTLYGKAEEGGYDVVRGRDIQVSPTGEVFGIEKTQFYKGVLLGEEYVQSYIMGKVAPYLWGAIYKRSLFTEDIFRNFLFVSRQEDWVTQISIAAKVKSICYIGDVVQAYMINDNSIMQTCITDYSYVLKIQKALENTTSELSVKAKQLLACDRIKELNRCFFFPELKFDWSIYWHMKQFLKDGDNFKIVSRMTDVKFLKFMQNPFLFWLYTTTYKVFFKKKRLHGKTRKVLK